MNGCSQCQEIPEISGEGGVLHIATPTGHTSSTIRGLLGELDLEFWKLDGDVLCVSLGAEDLPDFSQAIRDGLGAGELRDTRALYMKRGEEVGASDLARVETLGTLTASVGAGWLREIIRSDRLTTHFQPIVHAGDGRLFAYECLLRGVAEDSSLIGPGTIFEAAREAGMLFDLDRVARVKAIEEAARHDIRSNIFINFNPTSIYDPVYCLKSTMRAIESSGLDGSRIVFEVTESDEVRDPDHLYDTLAFYRNAGFKVALDDLGAGYSSLNLLSRLKPDFVKLDVYLTRDVESDPYKAMVANRLMELARDLEVRVVAEGIETEEQWLWFRERGAEYAQGYYFARPASPPPTSTQANPSRETRSA